MTWYDIFNDVMKLADTAKNQELFEILMNLRNSVSEMQDERDRLKDDNRELKNRIRELEQIQVTETDIDYNSSEPCFTLRSDVKKSLYCATCWSEHKKLTRLQTIPPQFI